MTSPQTKPAAPVTEIGYAQAPNYNWWQYQDETTPELIWPQSISVYDAMRRTDAQVTSVLRAMTLPVRSTPWRIDPNGASDEVTEFVADNLGLPIVGTEPKSPLRQQDRFSWDEHLRQALLMLPFGHMYFEQVYRVDPDGKARLRKLGPRMPKTIEKIDVAEDGGLISITQYWTRTDRTPRPIPVNRLVAYIHEREGGNWLGSSILRPGYKNWLLKDRLLRVWAQTIERNGMGVPRYTGAEGELSLATGLALAKAWRSGESAGAAIPFGSALDLVGVNGTLPDAEPAVRYHDEQLGRAVLAHFLNLGTQTGSWALGTTFADFFTLSLQSLAQQVQQTGSLYIIEDLVDVNWGPDEPAPKLVCDEIGSRQPATAQSLVALFGAGALTPDDRLEESLRQQYGLPPKQAQFLVDQPGDGPAAPVDVAAVEVQASGPKDLVSAHIDVDDDDEPGQFGGPPSGPIEVQAKFNPGQPRDYHGRWSLTGAVIDALKAQGGTQDAAQFDDGRYVDWSSYDPSTVTYSLEFGDGEEAVAFDVEDAELERLYNALTVTRLRDTGAASTPQLAALVAVGESDAVTLDNGYVDWHTRTDDGDYGFGVEADGESFEFDLSPAEMDKLIASLALSTQTREAVESRAIQASADAAALIAALADFTGEVWAAEFNEDLHPRGAGGKFRSTFSRIQRALADWHDGNGPDDPLAEFKDREPLRDAAKKRGVTLKRGATRDQIRDALLDDIRAKRAAARGEEAPVKPSHRLTLSSPRFRDQDVGVYQEKSGKVSLYRESSSGQRGTRIVSVDSLADLEQWGRDHGEPQVASWAAAERGGGKPAAKKAAPRKAPGAGDDAEALLSQRSPAELRRLATALGVQIPAGVTTKRAIADHILKQVDTDIKHKGRDFPGRPLDRMQLITEGLAAIERPTGPDDVTAAVDRIRALDPSLTGAAREGAVLRLLAGDAGLTSARLRRVADELGIDVPENMRAKSSLQLHIAEQVGAPSTPREAPAKRVPKTALTDRDIDARSARLRDAGPDVSKIRAELADLDSAQLRQMADAWLVDLPPRAARPRLESVLADGIAGRLRDERASSPRSPFLEPQAPRNAWNGPPSTVGMVEDFDPNYDPAPDGAVFEAPDSEVRQAVEEAWLALTGGESGKWAKLPDIRERIGDRYPFAQVNRVLRDINRERGGDLLGQLYQEQLTQRDRDGRVNVGHKVYHELAFSGEQADRIRTERSTGTPTATDPLSDLRTMDTESARDALDLRKVPELKALLKAEGLPVSGVKRALVDRLVEHLGGGGGPKGDGAVRASRPGQRYRHGWIPIGPDWTVELAQVEDASDEHLADLFGDAVHLAATDPDRSGELLDALDAEQNRRSAPKPVAAEDRERSQRTDELVAEGWDYLEAYADVHGLDPTAMRQEERLSEVRRRQGIHGGSAESHMRRMYQEETAVRWLAAEEATNGHMLSTAGRTAALDGTRKRSVDGQSLFSGPATGARKYASDELKAWWEAHGGRVTYAEWRARLLGDKNAVQRSTQSGAGEDFGI